MRNCRRSALLTVGLSIAVAFPVTANRAAVAQKVTLAELVSSVVRIKTQINPDGTTARTLGRERDGSGVVIDENGLVLTIGYLMVEAYGAEITTNDGHSVPANIVGYDAESGFGLLRAAATLKFKPLPLGTSADVRERDPVVVASYGGLGNAGAAYVVSKREFAGNWEYALDDAIFTAPPHPAWSGAALISQQGKLVGIGSLIVGDAGGKDEKMPGNMFVPIDRLPPILADLVLGGRISGPGRPWLGMTTDELRGHLFVSAVSDNGPAAKAGIKRGDMIVGVGGEPAKSLFDFYHKVWSVGPAGVVVPLDVLQGSDKARIDVKSINRLDNLKLKSTF